jgi:hypothetical protein
MATARTEDTGLVPGDIDGTLTATATAEAVGMSKARVVKWLTGTQRLIVEAERAVDKARAMTPCQTADEDAIAQGLVKYARGRKKAAEENGAITQALSRLHKAFVAITRRSTSPWDEVIAIGTKLHNDYVAAEQRRAEAERRRLQEEEDRRAAAARQAELDELERQAAAAEEASPDLSDREARIVDALVNGSRRLATVDATEVIRIASTVGYRRQPSAACISKIVAAVEAQRSAKAIRSQAKATAAAPVEARTVEVKPNVQKVGIERRTRSAILKDEQALIAAILKGAPIPHTLLTINTTELNRQARELGELINDWPGVEFKETVTLV